MSSSVTDGSLFQDEALPEPPAIPDEDTENGKLQFRKALGFLIFILFFICFFACLLQFCLTCSGTSDTTFANGTSIFLPEKSCKDLRQVVPLRWVFLSFPHEEFKCNWRPGLVALRIFCSLFGFTCIGLLFCDIFPKIHLPSTVIWITYIFCALTAFMMFVSIIVDGAAATSARHYCAEGFPGGPFLPQFYDEQSGSFDPRCYGGYATGVVFSDVFSFLSLAGMVAYFIFYKRQESHIGQIIPKGVPDTEDTPIAQGKKNAVAEDVQDESLTQDVTGANPFDPKSGM